MRQSRRDVLRAIFGASALASVPACWPYVMALKEQTANYLVIGDGTDESPQGNPYLNVTSRPGRVLFLNAAILEAKETPDAKSADSLIRIELPFRPHGVTQNPKLDTQFAAFEKWGQHAAIFNLADRSGSILLKDKSCRFFGHGVFATSGEKVFAAVYCDRRARGFVAVYSAKDGKKLSEYDSGGAFPHDCQLDSLGRIMVIHRRGRLKTQEQENVLSWLDQDTGRVIDRLVLPSFGEGVLYHFRQFEDGWVVASGAAERESATKPGFVLAISPPKEGTQASEAKRFQRLDPATKGLMGESLSLESYRLAEKSVVVVTNPVANSVHYWDFRQNKLIATQELESCRGVLENAGQLLLTSGLTRSLWTRGSEKNELREIKQLAGKFGNGSHLHSFRISGPIKRRV